MSKPAKSKLIETHKKPKHQVCELCCMRAYQVLSPIGTCDKCTDKLQKEHDLQFLRNRVVELEMEVARLTKVE